MRSTTRRFPFPAALLLVLALPASANAQIPIGGQVHAGDRPAPEAAVSLVPVLGGYEQGRLHLAGTADPEPIARAQTDAGGLFRLEAPGIGLYKLRVELEGRVPREMQLLPLLHAMELPAVDLEHDSELEITLTADGEPVRARLAAFATDPAINRVVGRPWPLGEPGEWSRPTFVGWSDEHGVVRVPATGEEKAWALEVVAEGLVPLASVEARPGRRLKLELRAGVRRELAAVDGRGEPLSEALLFPSKGVLPLALTDAGGRAALAAPSGVALDLEALDVGSRSGSLRLEPVTSGSEPRGAREILLEEPRTVSGQVVAKSSRDPIAGALVWFGRWPIAEAVAAGARGEYTLRLPATAPETQRLMVQAAAVGYVPAWQGGGSQNAPGPTIALAPAAGLAGRVTDADGHGLAGVEIGISRIETERMRGMRGMRVDFDQRQARTSRDGRFRLPGLPAESPYRLRFDKAGFAPAKLDVEGLEPFAERSDLEVVLVAGRRAVGRVTDESDLPVAGAEVRLVEPDPRRDGLRFGLGEEEPAPAHSTDVRGRFTVPDLAPGRYDLEVSSPGFGPVSVPGVEVPGGDGEVDLGTVVLPPGVAIEGRVVDAAGGPVQSVEIRATEPFGRPMPAALQRLVLSQTPPDAVTGADGRFTVADRRPGERLDLNVAAEGYVAKTVSGVVAPPEEPLAIVLQAASRVRGRVVDAAGEPVEGASVQARPEGLAGSGGRRGGSLERARSGNDGRFELTGVEPGRLTLVAAADGFQRSQLSGLEVAAGGELAGVELVLRAGATVRGSVRSAAGEPVAEAQVAIVETGGAGRPEAWATTDGDGRFELSGVGVGRRTISVRDEGSRTASKTVEVEAGTQEVEIAFAAGVEISGRVVGPDGAGVGGATVHLTAGSEGWRGQRQEATTAADGSFTLSDVAAGTYGLKAIHRDFADGESSERVAVASSPIAGLEIRLGAGATLSGRLLGLDVDELAQVRVYAGQRVGAVDFEGAYSVPHQSPGEVYVRAEIPGTGRQAVKFVTIEEGASEVTADLEFGSGHVLTGTVALGGEVLPAVTVRLEGVSVRHGARDVTDHRGRFRLEGLVSGTYRLYLHSFESGVEHSEELEVLADDDVRVEVGSGRIAGRVRDRSDSRAVEGVRLRLTSAAKGAAPGTWHQVTSDSEGRFGFGAVPEGRWTLLAVKAGYADAETAVETRAGDVVQDLEVLLSPAKGLAFEVAAAAPVRYLYAAFLDGAGRRIGGGAYEAAEGGRVEVTTVPDGSWEMLVVADDSATASVQVTVPGDAGRIVLAPGGGLRVDVPDLADGLVEAQLRLVGPDGRAHRGVRWGGEVRTDLSLRSGRATVENLAPGAWTLVVTAADGRSWSGSATVAPGETAEATLR